MKNTIRLIASGKGGAGKTTLTGALLHQLMRASDQSQAAEGLRFFALDADPAETLATALGWNAKLPEKGIGELKTELSEQDIPGDEVSKMRYVFSEVTRRAISHIQVGKHRVDFAYMGHHHENSCLCAFNTAVNSVLMQILDSKAHDYVLLDRDAGLEHINRSVYNGENDVLMVVAWPRRDYLSVAQKIVETADDLGTTRKRFLVLNAPFGAAPDEAQRAAMLKEYHLGGMPHFVFPSIPRQYDETLPEALEKHPEALAVLEQIAAYLESLRS